MKGTTVIQPQLFPVADEPDADAGVVWREPPSDRRRTLPDEVIEALRAWPGRWAVVRTYSSLTAVKQTKAFKHPPDIELRGTTEPPGSVLYARARPRT